MTKGKGYLLPSGDASEDELECCLVFYPARDEYRRALMGSLDYLATWIAWERDSEKRGQDAAASWKLANIQTWECCSMGYCDDLLTTLQELLAATQALECCGEQDITDGRQYTDEIVDGVGDVPQNIIDAGYADDAADWDGFDDYKCMISHLAVDHVESFLREIAPHISNTGIVIGGVGVVGALVGAILTIAGFPISAGIIIALGAAAAVWTWITGEGRDAVEDLADEIATNHDALACAIYQGDGVTESVDDFNDEVDSLFTVLNATMIKAINIEPQLRAMYAGRYDQEDIAGKMAELGYDLGSFSCVCAPTYDMVAEWIYVDGVDGPHSTDRRMQWVDDGWDWNEHGGLRTFAISAETAFWKYTGAQAATKAGESYSGSERFFIEHMELDWEPGPTCANAPRFFTHNEGFQAPAESGQSEGTYTKDWSPGNEPEVASDQELAPGAAFTSGNMDDFDDNGMVHRFLVGGFIAEGS